MRYANVCCRMPHIGTLDTDTETGRSTVLFSSTAMITHFHTNVSLPRYSILPDCCWNGVADQRPKGHREGFVFIIQAVGSCMQR